MKFSNNIFPDHNYYEGFAISNPTIYNTDPKATELDALYSLDCSLRGYSSFDKKAQNLLMSGYNGIEMIITGLNTAKIRTEGVGRLINREDTFYNVLNTNQDIAKDLLMEILDYAGIVPVFKNEEGYNNESGVLYGHISLYGFNGRTMDEKIQFLREKGFPYFDED